MHCAYDLIINLNGPVRRVAGETGAVNPERIQKVIAVSTDCPTDSVYLEEEAETRIRNRLRRLNGQVSGIERMLVEHGAATRSSSGAIRSRKVTMCFLRQIRRWRCSDQ